MILKNNEEKRSTLWRTVLTVSTVLIIIVAVFFIVRLFVGNPLKGTWVSEDSGAVLEILDDGELKMSGTGDGGSEEISATCVVDTREKILNIPIIRFFMTVMTPVIFIINLFSRFIMLLLRVDPNGADRSMTEDELRTIVDVSHEDGVIESDEKEMIYNVFDLGDANAKDIMVPRVHVTFADVNNTYDELINIFREDKFTRLPVFEDTQDNIVGIINMKDLLLYDKNEAFHIRDIMRQPHFTYEYKNISELLVEMRESTFNIAIVLDEYGEMAGLITLEDILEEIVGEIHDEYDEKEDELVFKLSDHEYVIEGSMNLDDVNDRLDTRFESEDYDSLGGFIIEHLDRLPEVGDEVCTEDGIRLVVETLDKNRVESVHVYLPEENDPETPDSKQNAEGEASAEKKTENEDEGKASAHSAASPDNEA